MFTAILMAIGAIALTTIVVALLGWDNIVEWFTSFFSNRKRIKNKDDVAFTIKQKIANGNVKVVQGIFNKQTETIEDGVEYEAEKLDEQLSSVHADEDLVVYE